MTMRLGVIEGYVLSVVHLPKVKPEIYEAKVAMRWLEERNL